jgi:hypothetical protein
MSANLDDVIRWTKASLPSLSITGQENFADDPFVKRFYEMATRYIGEAPTLLVAWQGPAEPVFLKTPFGPVVVRSERLDPLLIEYLHLSVLVPVSPLPIDMIDRAVLRWIAEFCLGHGNALAASYAIVASNMPVLRLMQWPIHNFRDELLMSVPQIDRAAAQCLTLGHELGHATQTVPPNCTLETEVDGLSLMDHVKHDLREFQLPADRGLDLIRMMEKTDIGDLVLEIEADRVGFEMTMVFLYERFECDWKQAVQATLRAYEALSFLQALCRSTYSLEIEPQSAFEDADWVYRTQTSIRARCLMRRAGYLLAKYSLKEGERLISEKVNACLPIIDGMFVDSVQFRMDLTTRTLNLVDQVRQHTRARGPEEKEAMFAKFSSELSHSHEARLDLFYMGCAAGYPGGTNFLKLLRWMFDRQAKIRST